MKHFNIYESNFSLIVQRPKEKTDYSFINIGADLTIVYLPITTLSKIMCVLRK